MNVLAVLENETMMQPMAELLRAMEPDTVNDVAVQFGGGGHAQAAGCTIRGLSLYEAAEKVLQAIEAKL